MITVDLTPYEARSLVRAAGWLDNVVGELCGDNIDEYLPEGHFIPPLQSASMKLEMALTLEQEQA